jgi:hypothetical protein
VLSIHKRVRSHAGCCTSCGSVCPEGFE